jgi:hypothetical protein
MLMGISKRVGERDMNLREVQLSSRCVIPVALALPINREPGERANEARERDRRDGGERPSINRPLEFNL